MDNVTAPIETPVPATPAKKPSVYRTPNRRPISTSIKKIDDATIVVPQFVPTSPARDSIRIIPLGGVEEIGKNMTLVEFRDEIVIIDAGFAFPGEEAPGVDYIIPDTTYLQKKKHMIKGIFITHGHLDHIGGIPYLIDKIGNPPIYTRLLTSVMIKKETR